MRNLPWGCTHLCYSQTYALSSKHFLQYNKPSGDLTYALAFLGSKIFSKFAMIFSLPSLRNQASPLNALEFHLPYDNNSPLIISKVSQNTLCIAQCTLLSFWFVWLEVRSYYHDSEEHSKRNAPLCAPMLSPFCFHHKTVHHKFLYCNIWL